MTYTSPNRLSTARATSLCILIVCKLVVGIPWAMICMVCEYVVTSLRKRVKGRRRGYRTK